MIWHDIRDPADPRLDDLAREFNLHPLHIEDCRHRDQSAKVEFQDGYLFVVLKTIEMDDECSLNIGDFDLFVGREFLITVQETKCLQMTEALERAHAIERHASPDQILHRIMDGLVDSYRPILYRISDRIDAVEDAVLENPKPELLQKIFDMKRSLVEMRRTLANTRDLTANLQRTETDLIRKELQPFFRDVYDHSARALDTIEMQRDLLSGAIDIYMSSVANRANEVMKVLTIAGTVATPALVISGFYGMNVKLPGAEDPNAVVYIAAGIIGVTITLLLLWRWQSR